MEGVFTKNVSGFLTVYAHQQILGATTKPGDGDGDGDESVKRNEPN